MHAVRAFLGRLATAGRVVTVPRLVLALLAACNTERAALDEAKEQHARGELDRAISTLERVREKDAPEASEARTLAVEWLVAAADGEGSPHAARARLDQALAWNEASGEAQARVCKLLVDAGKLEEGKRCLGEGLGGKEGAPDAIVAATREALAKAESKATDGERKRLLASPSKHDWQKLVENFPTSSEATSAKEKIRKTASLCSDFSGLVKILRDEVARQSTLATVALPAARALADVGKRHEALQQIGKDCEPNVRALKNASVAVREHDVLPGEGAAQRPLEEAFWAVADRAGDLSDGLVKHRIESDESYEGAASDAIGKWLRAREATEKKVEKTIADVEELCAVTGSAAP